MNESTIRGYEDRVLVCLENMHPRARVSVRSENRPGCPHADPELVVVVEYHGRVPVTGLKELPAEDVIDLLNEVIPTTWTPTRKTVVEYEEEAKF